ncbi:MAG: hypothetical protein WCJ59_01555 [bacterium]
MFLEFKTIENEKFEKEFKQMMDELNNFYDINWVHHLPKIYFLDSRAQIDYIWGEKTLPYIVGWARNHDTIFVLKNEKMVTESAHKQHSDGQYYSLIKHELSHCFFTIESKYTENSFPKWLWEGVAIYTSGQLVFKDKIVEFKEFLDHYDNGFAPAIYKEAGFAVEILVNKFGKKKLLSLIKNLKNLSTKELFDRAFEKEYGFKPSHEQFNLLLKSVLEK